MRVVVDGGCLLAVGWLVVVVSKKRENSVVVPDTRYRYDDE